MSETKRLLLVLVLLTAVCAAGNNSASGQTPSEETAIRAGRNVAVTACVACHAVSRDQAVKPVLGSGIPSFEEIANRPDTTVDSLRAAMKVARWHDPSMAAALLPMSRISDAEKTEVASYILSLRAKR